MGKAVIIACDFKDKEETLNFLNKFEDEKLYLKIGMELFYSEGPEIVREIKERGHKIFLDLKSKGSLNVNSFPSKLLVLIKCLFPSILLFAILLIIL